ncbi:4Fe-4S dicluster domain-containing protein [Geobacter sp. DSM 9736]|uniref:4Fe-4S dicluster domain-containing protein n=1 Tax=Geobacter sp. DSM 9736 TaxID=1277350 RepID=UPI000B4FE2E8|nr:4Fe-4S dicluster domain-containing protein [Geobacter sp. DSM 9736]SNB45335.1 prokaryotic molybdopterin-containing oxidoreductase family, iron-sulfur binding subunit [Geobacter sp. DSM 9736]
MEKDVLVRMQEDLERALKKPAEKRRWAMLLDTRKCTKCSACTVACASENKLPPGQWYRPVWEEEKGTYPKLQRIALPRPCLQCDKPPCVSVCPVKGPDGATWKETKGIGAGIVPINYAKCIGCGKCVPGCPYGARFLDNGKFHTEGAPRIEKYETMPSFEYGKNWPRQGKNQPVGNARKCHFCMHRLANGMLPQCISSCVCRMGYFGDENDAESLIAQTIKANKANLQILKKNLGTLPRVYYLGQTDLSIFNKHLKA